MSQDPKQGYDDQSDDQHIDIQLRELLSQHKPPPPPKTLMPQLLRSAARAQRLAIIGGTRRGFAFGALSASLVCIALAFGFVVSDGTRMAHLSTQAKSWFGDADLIASSDTSFWESSYGDNLEIPTALISNPGSQVLNLSENDIGSQDVTAILNAPIDLQDAVVRISLDSGIELRDLPGLNVVEWKSDFVKGDNVINLSLATIEDEIDRFNSLQVRVSHPDYSAEIWINIAHEEHHGL